MRFSPTAWAKLWYLRDLGPTEVGGFGISAPDDLLFVQDLQLVQQHCSETFVAFEDSAVADFFEEQVDLGRKPEEFGRIWIHTHPGSCSRPSRTDVDTFHRVFGHCDWAVMFIMARSGDTHAELHWKAGAASLPMDVDVDFPKPFAASDHASWDDEYRVNVHPESCFSEQRPRSVQKRSSDTDLDAEYRVRFAGPLPHKSSCEQH